MVSATLVSLSFFSGMIPLRFFFFLRSPFFNLLSLPFSPSPSLSLSLPLAGVVLPRLHLCPHYHRSTTSPRPRPRPKGASAPPPVSRISRRRSSHTPTC